MVDEADEGEKTRGEHLRVHDREEAEEIRILRKRRIKKKKRFGGEAGEGPRPGGEGKEGPRPGGKGKKRIKIWLKKK